MARMRARSVPPFGADTGLSAAAAVEPVLTRLARDSGPFELRFSDEMQFRAGRVAVYAVAKKHGWQAETNKAGDTALRVTIQPAPGWARVKLPPADEFRGPGLPQGVYVCQTCGTGQGYIWPMASDGDDSHDYVERCDGCERFDSDEDAAQYIADRLAAEGFTFVLAYKLVSGAAQPYIEDVRST